MSDANPENPKGSFSNRAWEALQRILWAVIFAVAHKGLDIAIHISVPARMSTLRELLEDMAAVVFSLIYVYLLWELLKVFIGWLSSGRKDGR